MYRYMQKRYKFFCFLKCNKPSFLILSTCTCVHINLQTSRVDEVLVDEVLVQTALSHLTQKLKPK